VRVLLCPASRRKPGATPLSTFAASEDAGFTRADFAGKLLGKTATGGLLYGYVRMPGHTQNAAILSGRPPKRNGGSLVVTVENFGLTASAPAVVSVTVKLADKPVTLKGLAPAIAPYGRTEVRLELPASLPSLEKAKLETVIDVEGAYPEKFDSILP
jgi:hypothetical protein